MSSEMVEIVKEKVPVLSGGTMRIGENGHLLIGDCDTVELAGTYGTPLFVYDEALLRSTIQSFHHAFLGTGVSYEVTYASKAFCTIAMCRLVYEEGCAIDVVSGGELFTALAAKVPPAKIHFHGNNKTEEELLYAVDENVGVIIVDNEWELALLNRIAAEKDKKVDILIRVSPGVSAHTHEFISTGQQDSKFGFDYESGQAFQILYEINRYAHLRLLGVHAHIGSQIFEQTGFSMEIKRLASVYAEGKKAGLPLSVFNVGGGFGIRYTDTDDPISIAAQIESIVDFAKSEFASHGLPLPTIWVEPGRSIAGPAGTTLYRVGSQKQIPDVRNYLAVDGGMTDNPRLALYGAKYEAIVANKGLAKAVETWSIAGKCCESGDVVIWDANIAHPDSNDILAVFATGAYNYSMASHYNRIPNPAVVFVQNGESRVVVRRETWADVARNDVNIE
jgi:diaminopimelate decarboxylase